MTSSIKYDFESHTYYVKIKTIYLKNMK